MSELVPVEPSKRQPLLWLVALDFFMQTLDSTIVNTALPAMASSLGEKPVAYAIGGRRLSTHHGDADSCVRLAC